MDASGAYAINAPWNETMANFHNWSIGAPNPKDKRNKMADAASVADASITSGHWVDRVKEAGTARKINDFTLNGKGDLTTSTTDRVMSRLALGTDDADFAAGMLGAAQAGSYIDPITNEVVTLSGYERISRAADRVAIAMGAPNEAAGQARMWIEFFGPEAAYGLPPDDVVAQGLARINQWVEEQVVADAHGVHVPIGSYKAKGLNPSRMKK